MSDSPTAIEAFCSYAHADQRWRQKLEKHLSPLKHQGLFSLWHDRCIRPGTDWKTTIDHHLDTASMILLLISADFFASDYCYGIEMKRALERHQAGQARVIPIILRPVDWQHETIASLHALPTDATPITLWRNKDDAFADVAAGIRRAIEDLSLPQASAPRAALPAIWNVPYPHNVFFVGRDDLLSCLHAQLDLDQQTTLSPPPRAIGGLGGIGKTQIAVEYAYRYHQDYQVVLWAQADNRETLMSSYVTIAHLLKLPELDAQEQTITVEAVKHWLRTHRQWLLILDNASELALLPEFLPPSLGGHVLVTTHAQAMGRLAVRIEEIETLSPAQSALLLLRRAGWLASDAPLETAVSEDRALAVQIAQEFGGLPLALDQAGAYLEETGCGLDEYLHGLELEDKDAESDSASCFRRSVQIP